MPLQIFRAFSSRAWREKRPHAPDHFVPKTGALFLLPNITSTPIHCLSSSKETSFGIRSAHANPIQSNPIQSNPIQPFPLALYNFVNY
jgi:hypothetical protein